MALQLNLLHEEIAQHRQRQRDPLKIGMLVLVGVTAVMIVFYMWKTYETHEVKRELAAVQHDWAEVEPKVTSAQNRSSELNGIINTTKVLDTMVEGRFYWAPFLEKLSRSVAPNAQLNSFDGAFNGDTKALTATVDGIAAGREPRAASEELRQLLTEQLSETYGNVAVDFMLLEDLDTVVNVAGVNMATARFSLNIKLTPAKGEPSKGAASPAPARVRKS